MKYMHYYPNGTKSKPFVSLAAAINKALDKIDYGVVEVRPYNTKTIFLGAISIISFVVLMFNLNITWLQIWLVPKIYLIEYVKTLITK